MVSEARYYTLVNSLEDLEKFLSTLPEEKQTFSEVILGENKQKPRFDIDDVPVELVPEMFEAFGSLFEGLGIELKELFWYSSSNQSKQSYHLVLPHYYFETSFEAKRLWHYVQENIDSRFTTYIDSRVYSITQCFRLLGSQKQGSGRPKRLMKSWNYHDIVIEQQGMLKDSLVSYVLEGKLFPSFDIKQELTSAIRGELTGDVAEYQKIIEQYIGSEFQFWTIKDNIIFYRRLSPSFCEICKKEHDSVGTYFSIHDEFIVQHCYRSELYHGKPIFISRNSVIGLEDYDQSSIFEQVRVKETLFEKIERIDSLRTKIGSKSISIPIEKKNGRKKKSLIELATTEKYSIKGIKKN